MGNGHSVLFFFFGWAMIWAVDWAQIWQGLTRPAGPGGGGSRPGEKNLVSKGSSSGHRLRPTGRIRVWKNPARTRPVVIPIFANVEQ